MTLADLDPILTTPKRLAALGIVSAGRRVDFSFIRDQLDLSDSDLSKQLKPLTDAGYITTRKTGRGTTRRTWVSVTKIGTDALDNHARALQALITPTAMPAPAERPSIAPSPLQ